MGYLHFVILVGLLLLSGTSYAQESLSLSQFLEYVQKQNLDLKVNKTELDYYEAKASGVSLPPPTVTWNQMKMDASKEKTNGFEVSQTIPFPTKIIGDSEQRNAAANAAKEKSYVREKEILSQAKVLYFKLWSLQEKISLLKEEKSILEKHIKLARSTARSDSFASVHVLKTESDLDLLDSDLQDQEQEKRQLQRQISNFLNQDPRGFQLVAQEPPLSPIPKLIQVEESHQLKALQYEVESAKSNDAKTKSLWLPDLMFSYKKMNKSSMYPQYSELMVGVTLPFVFFWEPYGESKASSAKKRQAQFELDKQRREILSQRENLLENAQILKKQIFDLKEKTIPRAQKRIKLVRNLAPRDMETLQDHRDTMEALPKLKERALELRVQYEKVISDLEKYF